MTKKVIFAGPPSAGKTSIRKFFFENKPSFDLLDQTIEPTVGVTWHNYQFPYGASVGVVDTSGQEIIELVENEELFYETDALIYMFDVKQFLEMDFLQTEFISYLRRLIEMRDRIKEEYEIHLFVHKIDLLEYKTFAETQNKIEKRITEFLETSFGNDHNVGIHFTSLVLDDELQNTLKEIVHAFSISKTI